MPTPKVQFKDKSQSGAYEEGKFNAQDANEIKAVINSHATTIDNLLARLATLEEGGGGGGPIITPDLDAPTISAVVNSTTQITVNWFAALATGYVLERATNAGFTAGLTTKYTGSGTSFVDSGLNPATTYYYRVKATATGYNNSPTASTSATTQTAALPTLNTPAALNASVSTNAITVSWGSVSNATSYVLERATDAGFNTAVQIYAGASVQYSDTGLTAGTAYFYRVKALASGYNTSGYGAVNATTTGTTVVTPNAPTGPVVDDTADTFDWTYTPGYTTATSYEYTLDGGLSWNSVSAKPFPVGNIAKAAGQVGVRVKAVAGINNISSAVFNVTPYTVASSVTTPATPTGAIMNDTENTFDFTFVPEFPALSAYQYTINGGTTWSNVTVKPIVVPNADIGAYKVGVRVKAIGGNHPSEPLYASEAYTIYPPEGEVIDFNSWALRANVMVGENTNDLVQAVPGPGVGEAISEFSLKVGDTGFIQTGPKGVYKATLPDLDQGTYRMGLREVNSPINNDWQEFPMFMMVVDNKSGRKIDFKHLGSFPSVQLDYYSDPTKIKIRMRIELTKIHYEYTINGGQTWVQIHMGDRPAGDLYPRFLVNSNMNLSNAKFSGFTPIF